MELITNLERFNRPASGCVLTIGNFDGLHLGHQEIINSAGNLAGRKGLPFYVMTFEPPPAFVLRREKRPPQITTPQMKLKLLEETNLVEGVIMLEPNMNFLAMTPREFVWDILVQKLDIKYIVEGQTFNFGARGCGTIITLQELGLQYGFEAYITPSSKFECSIEGPTAISSTLVRSFISKGEFNQVRKCLGRNYVLGGTVVSGRGKGREIGFPTANLKVYNDGLLVPEDGVFACRAKIGSNFEHVWNSNDIYQAAVSLGHCQTFEDGVYQIEAFLLDFEGEYDSLVDKHILLEFVDKLRDQEKYDSIEELTKQIDDDCKKVKEIVSSR